MRRHALYLVGVPALVAGAALLWPRTSTTGVDPTPSSPFVLSFEPDTLYRYRLDYAAHQTTSPLQASGASALTGVGAIESRVAYVGEVHWRLLSRIDDGWMLGMRLARCESMSLTVAGDDMWPSEASCSARLDPLELVVQLDHRGRVVAVREPDRAPEVWGYLAGYLASELSVTWPSASERSYSEREEDMLGTVASVYDVVDEEPVRLRVVRTRGAYEALDAASWMRTAWSSRGQGKHHIAFDARGHLESLRGAQTVTGHDDKDASFLQATRRVSLTFVERARDTSPKPSTTHGALHRVKEARNDERARERTLAARTRGLTADEALSTLSRFASGGQLPDHNLSLWRMTALLELQPTLAESLAPIFTGGNTVARMLVLDLLASAGTKEAQAVMRTLVASDEAKADPDRHLLSQRLGLLTAPDDETVRFVLQRYEDTDVATETADHFTAAYTLGAIARHVDDATGATLRGHLVRELDATDEPARVASLLSALGNARFADDADRFAAFARHRDADVRLSAANQLGRPATDVGRAALLQLVADPDRGVQKQAIRSLRHHPLVDADFDAMTAIVQTGGLHHTNQRAMVELSKIFRRDAPAGTGALLEALIASKIDDNQVSAAARQLLAWGASAGR